MNKEKEIKEQTSQASNGKEVAGDSSDISSPSGSKDESAENQSGTENAPHDDPENKKEDSSSSSGQTGSDGMNTGEGGAEADDDKPQKEPAGTGKKESPSKDESRKEPVATGPEKQESPAKGEDKSGSEEAEAGEVKADTEEGKEPVKEEKDKSPSPEAVKESVQDENETTRETDSPEPEIKSTEGEGVEAAKPGETADTKAVKDTKEAEPEKEDTAGPEEEKEKPAANGQPDTPDAEGKKSKAGLESEVDLKEKDDDDHDDDDEEADYSEMSKEELVEVIKGLAKNDEVIKAEREAREVKHAFDEIREKEREEALEKFVAEGGDAMDFAYRPDELTLRFDANYQLIRDKKTNFVKNKEQQKEVNLKKKEEVLERLREFVDSEETNISFETFKALQEEWKSIGPVPGAIARSMWANYNALVDRFYDKRSIYFELKELDRKKNLESKLELCHRAEALAEVTNINDAIKELNELHHEFKHIGPVPKEEQEPLWNRFKAASDAVYERRKEFVEKLKGELEKNLTVKLELANRVSEFAEFDSDRIKAWNEKTRELLDIQKKWENTGGLPRARAKEVNRSFWSAFKQFFANKNQFFKKLDAEREKNLEKKKEMVERAKSLKESDNWQETAEKLKALQREWKDVGPVPGKYRESVYKEFKEACDTFFDRKRASQDDASKDYAENYKYKLEICSKIEKLAKGDKNNLKEFRALQEEYNETGFVPRNKISDIRNRYSEVVNAYVKALEGMTEEEKQRIKIENQVSDILHSPNADQKLYRKEQSLRKQISSIENDIAVWKNNLEFFADSKKANKLKDEFQSKIDSANDELRQLKQQLKIIRTA